MVLATENPAIIKSIQQIFKSELENDFWNELSDSQKNEIDEALIEIENGVVVNYTEFISKHKID